MTKHSVVATSLALQDLAHARTTVRDSGPVAAIDPKKRRISLLLYHQQKAQAFVLSEGDSLIVGRGESASVTIEDKRLSRHHARFFIENGTPAVEDLGSTNGTRVNETTIDRCALTASDTVSLGAVLASVHVMGAPELATITHDAFWASLELELERARYFGRQISMLLIETAASTESRAASAREDSLLTVQSMMRPIDRLAWYSDTILELLLPECSEQHARSIAERAFGHFSVALGVFPRCATSPSKLIETTLATLRETQPGQLQLASLAEHGRALELDSEAPIVCNTTMRELHDDLSRAANSRIPILLMGETGTGKEVLARMIHRQSRRTNRPLISINCGAIPKDLVESSLFGHQRGAFTGATSDRAGVFEAAAGGTVMLDEVAELTAGAQAALLRVLESGTLMRVGSTDEIEVDVRVVAATNRDLEEMVAEGTFRADLFYRLNTFTLVIPPLRQRPDEVAPLCQRFLAQANRMHHRSVESIDAGAMRLLHAYSWPGNIRELRNIIERAVVIARQPVITAEELPSRLQRLAAHPAHEHGESVGAARSTGPVVPLYGLQQSLDLRTRVKAYETRVILEALDHCEGDRQEAAGLLKIPLRTLSTKITKLGLKKTYE
jgi:DNA-binding NtrC family response regulator